MIKPGDMIGLENNNQGLVIEVWDFQRYCVEADNECLEIDIDSAWENWEERGPLLVVLNPITQKLQKVWRHGSE